MIFKYSSCYNKNQTWADSLFGIQNAPFRSRVLIYVASVALIHQIKSFNNHKKSKIFEDVFKFLYLLVVFETWFFDIKDICILFKNIQIMFILDAYFAQFFKKDSTQYLISNLNTDLISNKAFSSFFYLYILQNRKKCVVLSWNIISMEISDEF